MGIGAIEEDCSVGDDKTHLIPKTNVPINWVAVDDVEPAWVSWRLSFLGERMEAWKRNRLEGRGIRLS